MSRLKSFWKSLGPGLVAGAADDDPSGIAVYSLAGAKFGLGMLWTVIATLPFMIIIQRMAGRIGLISGRGLAGNMKRHYPGWILTVVTTSILIANIINIGADISAMAAATALLLPAMPTMLMSALISATIILLLIFLSYRQIARYLKWVAIILFAYVGAAFMVHQPWHDITFRTFIPPWPWDRAYLGMLIAIFGTTISPYLFFWQASEAIEEEREKALDADRQMIPHLMPRNPRRSGILIKNEVGAMYKDIYFGMGFSNFITFFIIILSAATLHQNGLMNVNSISEIASVLRPIAGNYANFLFLIGIMASGILAIPVLAGSAAYALAETFGWRNGFDNNFGKAKQFYVVIIIATILGFVIPLFQLNPVTILYFTALIFGAISPFIIGVVIHMANNPSIVGKYTSRLSSNILAYILLIILSGSIVLMFIV